MQHQRCFIRTNPLFFFWTILSLLIILMLSHTVWETLNNQRGAGGDKAVAPSSIFFPQRVGGTAPEGLPFVVALSFVKLAQRMPSLSRQARETGSRLWATADGEITMQEEESHSASAKRDVKLVTPPRDQIQSRVRLDRILSHRIASSHRMVSWGITLHHMASYPMVSYRIP